MTLSVTLSVVTLSVAGGQVAYAVQMNLNNKKIKKVKTLDVKQTCSHNN